VAILELLKDVAPDYNVTGFYDMEDEVELMDILETISFETLINDRNKLKSLLKSEYS